MPDATDQRDSIYPAAVLVAASVKDFSIWLLQRHLRVGYGRASRLIDRMCLEELVQRVDDAGNFAFNERVTRVRAEQIADEAIWLIDPTTLQRAHHISLAYAAVSASLLQIHLGVSRPVSIHLAALVQACMEARPRAGHRYCESRIDEPEMGHQSPLAAGWRHRWIRWRTVLARWLRKP